MFTKFPRNISNQSVQSIFWNKSCINLICSYPFILLTILPTAGSIKLCPSKYLGTRSLAISRKVGAKSMFNAISGTLKVIMS